MSDKWNYHPNRGPHPEPAYNEWAYNGYPQHQRPPPDYYGQPNFAVPPQYPCPPSGLPPQRLPTFPLNPNAATFVPRNYQRPNQTGPAMAYFPGDDVEVRAYEAMYNNQYGNGAVMDEYIPSQELHHDMIHSDNLVSLQEIQVGLEQLLSDADDFDSWSGAIRDRMTEKRMSPPTRAVAVHMIFEMGIAVSSRPLSGNSPQHTLARLVSFLCAEIPSLLRDTVLKLLCDFHSKHQSLHNEQKINLCVFFAEVYEKLETDNGTRIEKVGEALLEQLDDLLKLEMHDQLMKTIIQLVKLCGRHLDSSPVTEPLVNQLLTKLLAFAKGHPQLSESVKTQINCVVDLRKSGWGISSRGGGAASDTATSSSNHSVPSSGVIVGDDGAALDLNDEERCFLESQFNAMDGSEEHDQSFDEQEVMKDYGVFVREEEDREKERKCASMLEKLKVCESEPDKKAETSDTTTSPSCP
ncbi:unnamed protein product [Cylicocyclus nassatus]|uniref:MIF4G domain-containing protein n=1 Tax=Cylicocyclus nassatus TaxID=53992 RepID=A0AA36HCL3_CYLNA|nr:unnamed protein product [Cylicocyclus nassatus]